MNITIMNKPLWRIVEGNSPVIAIANHSGHALRDEIAARTALSDQQRLQEEDPFTDKWTSIAPTRAVATYSRFQVDLNRSREQAVYRNPEDAWGLDLWKEPLEEDMVARSLAEFDAYYAELLRLCRNAEEKFGCFVILDLHSYNHRRAGPDGPPADAQGNPEVNIGTGTMDRNRWGSLVDRFIRDLRAFDFFGRSLDVRENVKFVGRGFPIWTHTTFPKTGCTLAIEFKKFFMDEWTGEVDWEQHEAIRNALATTLTGLGTELNRVSEHA